jgi:hypothetical protein
MISNDRLQKALEYLATTDEPCAKAKAYLTGLDETTKTVKATEFLKASGTNGERDATAFASANYREHIEKLEEATYSYELVRNKRLTEALIIEVWRSINANRRNGNL